MNLSRRLNRLEQTAPTTRDPVDLTITHIIVEPGPDGPFSREKVVRRYVDGVLVEEWTDHSHASETA